MKIAVLGPGGVGGLLASALDRSSAEVLVVAKQSTCEAIAQTGIRLSSPRFGELTVHLRTLTRLREQVDVLIVATKASGLEAALDRIEAPVGLVLPLLNGLDHLAVLRDRFPLSSVLAGAIRVESDRPRPGVVVHTSESLRIDLAAPHAPSEAVAALLQAMCEARIPVRVLDSEAEVMWSKLVRLNALASMTSAYDTRLGEIRREPQLRKDLLGAIEEACAVAQAEGARIEPSGTIGELEAAHATLGSSMQRDIAADREPELDAIQGAVLRAAAKHQIECPTIARLTEAIAARAGVPLPSPLR